VGADGGLADDELTGDLGVGQAAGDQPEHLDLALGQCSHGGGDVGAGWRSTDELLDEPAGDVGGEQGVAGGDVAHGGGQLAGPDRLEQEAAGARAHRLVDVLVEVEGGQDQHAGGAAGDLDHPAGGLDAVQAGHAYVHEHHVGAQPAGQLDRLDAVVGLADDLDVFLGL
jgi:hypothetical protein